MQPHSGFGFATVIAAVIATVSGAAVTHVAERAEDLVTRSTQYDGNVFMCTDAGWSGSCTNLGFYSGGCVNFPSGFQSDVSSIGPDNGWNCYAFRNFGCGDIVNALYLEYPGTSDLSLFTGGWNDALNSIVCYPF